MIARFRFSNQLFRGGPRFKKSGGVILALRSAAPRGFVVGRMGDPGDLIFQNENDWISEKINFFGGGSRFKKSGGHPAAQRRSAGFWSRLLRKSLKEME